MNFILKRVLPIALIIFTCSMGIYWYFGGFDAVAVERKEQAMQYPLQGLKYEGRMGSPLFQQAFEAVRDQVKAGNLSAPLVVVQYPAKDAEHADVFIGGISTGKALDSMEHLTIQANRYYEVNLGTSSFVKPRPDQVLELIQQESIKRQESLQPYSLELYFPDNHVVVQVPVKP
ncbi:hypothetical protein [Persicobacter psychrovividus]|uniref:AraC family transcriptional regulator n=1 Tax=Persicobacter psychrovividus TaxID=387638 RepID=A0ABN6L5X0_9BACT|nr:hypothetical protein PEPS_07540 [Persicobacter psychrovividus]